MRLLRSMGWLLVVLGVLARVAGAGVQAAEASTPLAIEAIVVAPDPPAAETLCKLRLRVHNKAERAVSGLELRVALGGVDLAVYQNQLFMDLLAPQVTTEIELFNFWTSESDRPLPADGKLVLEVALERASWLEITTADDGTETWALLEAVPGLPTARRLELALRPSGAPVSAKP